MGTFSEINQKINSGQCSAATFVNNGVNTSSFCSPANNKAGGECGALRPLLNSTGLAWLGFLFGFGVRSSNPPPYLPLLLLVPILPSTSSNLFLCFPTNLDRKKKKKKSCEKSIINRYEKSKQVVLVKMKWY